MVIQYFFLPLVCVQVTPIPEEKLGTTGCVTFIQVCTLMLIVSTFIKAISTMIFRIVVSMAVLYVLL